MAEITQGDLTKLMEKLLRERAIYFREYKESTLARRVQRRLDATGSPSIDAYVQYLDRRPDEYAKLVDSILINVTEFFRDPEAWDTVRNEVFPRILSEKHPGDQIRFWCAGCASGEEPYSLAISLAEQLGTRLHEYDARIYATDIDEDALSVARRAEYPDDKMEKVPEDLRRKYFAKNTYWSVNRDIRKLVIYGRHNLVTDPPISTVESCT